MIFSTLVAEAQARQAKHVVLTGGEPTIHPLGPLIKALKEAGFFCADGDGGDWAGARPAARLDYLLP
jgi:organic radical activating enzyme